MSGTSNQEQELCSQHKNVLHATYTQLSDTNGQSKLTLDNRIHGRVDLDLLWPWKDSKLMMHLTSPSRSAWSSPTLIADYYIV